MNQRAKYQRPEIVAIGAATKLTLGSIGCTNDGHCCTKFVVEE